MTTKAAVQGQVAVAFKIVTVSKQGSAARVERIVLPKAVKAMFCTGATALDPPRPAVHK